MGHWTIAELAERAAAVLAADQQARTEARTRDARTRDVPDPRTIRWYQTTGLIDRPHTMRGRTALYGERHLAQLVAIKRLQARGRSLAAIQAELAGASDDIVYRLAALPMPSSGLVPEPGSTDLTGTDITDPTRTDRTEIRPRFWTARATQARPVPAPAAPANAAANAAGHTVEHTIGNASAEDADASIPYANGNPDGPEPTRGMHALRLATGVVLLLEGGRTPDGADIQALRHAAAPLLAELTSRALLEEL